MEGSSKPVSRVTGHLKNNLILNRQLVQEIAFSISRLTHSDSPTVPYNVAMANLFEVYHKELIQSDRTHWLLEELQHGYLEGERLVC